MVECLIKKTGSITVNIWTLIRPTIDFWAIIYINNSECGVFEYQSLAAAAHRTLSIQIEQNAVEL